MRKISLTLAALMLAACQQAAPPADSVAEPIVRPTFSLATDEAYDFAKIPVYLDNHPAVYTGEGTKTILPHQATAKVDSRLPPDIDPDEAMAKIRAHLDNNGFDDIEIHQLGGYPASQTSVEAAPVQSALSVFKKYSDNLSVQPRVAGSAPFYQFTDRLGLPLVPAGLGFCTGAHAPNEIMLIEPAEGTAAAGLAEVEKAYVDFIYALAESADQND